MGATRVSAVAVAAATLASAPAAAAQTASNREPCTALYCAGNHAALTATPQQLFATAPADMDGPAKGITKEQTKAVTTAVQSWARGDKLRPESSAAGGAAAGGGVALALAAGAAGAGVSVRKAHKKAPEPARVEPRKDKRVSAKSLRCAGQQRKLHGALRKVLAPTLTGGAPVPEKLLGTLVVLQLGVTFRKLGLVHDSLAAFLAAHPDVYVFDNNMVSLAPPRPQRPFGRTY